MTKHSEVVKYSALTFISRILGYASGFLLQFLFARLLGVKDFGFFSYGISLVNIIVIFTTLNTSEGLVRFIGEYKGKGDFSSISKITKSSFVLSLILSSSVFLLVVLFRESVSSIVFHGSDFKNIVPFFGFILVEYSILMIYSGIYRGFRIPHIFYTYRECFERVIRILIFLLILLVTHERLLGAIISTLISSAIIILLLYLKLQKSIKKKVAVQANNSNICVKNLIKDFLFFSIGMLFISTSQIFMSQINRVIIGLFLGSSDVGKYVIADLLSLQIIIFLMSFNSVFASMISEMYHTGREKELAKIYSDITRWTAALTIPLSVWMYIYSYDILRIFGKDYTEAASILKILIIAQFINAITGLNSTVLIMTKYQKLEVINSWVTSGINLSIAIALVPKIGIIGAAIGSALAISIVNIIRTLQVYYKLKILPYNFSDVKLIISGLIVVVLITVVKSFLSGIVGLITSLLTSYIAMFLILILLGVSEEDKKILDKILLLLRKYVSPIVRKQEWFKK